MKNLAGINEADETILEELYLANIQPIKTELTNTEVPYTYIGKVGNWTIKRGWRYWVATVDEPQLGLTLGKALELYNKKHPFKDDILGDIIRCGGSGGSPEKCIAQPIYNAELDNKLEVIGYIKEYVKSLKSWYISITYGEIAELCNSGKLDVERYVESYHIDEQVGLNEFVKFINGLI